MHEDRTALMLHASAVSVAGHTALIRGASGAGKSALTLQIMALGGALVSDDRTRVWRDGATLMADAPDTIRNRIEARGIGILNAPAAGPQPIALLIDLDGPPPSRLPAAETEAILGLDVPLVRGFVAAHFPAAIYLYLLHGRAA